MTSKAFLSRPSGTVVNLNQLPCGLHRDSCWNFPFTARKIEAVKVSKVTSSHPYIYWHQDILRAAYLEYRYMEGTHTQYPRYPIAQDLEASTTASQTL